QPELTSDPDVAGEGERVEAEDGVHPAAEGEVEAGGLVSPLEAGGEAEPDPEAGDGRQLPMTVVEGVDAVAAEHQVPGALDDPEDIDLDGRPVVLAGTEIDVPLVRVRPEREDRLDGDGDLDELLDLPGDDDAHHEVVRGDLDDGEHPALHAE